ncbi:MAG TPA: glycogen synthase GlgA [Acetobacteraceae bacterium]|nr:glycogen synthase GlgA [Acetobacteraceae bacterium]
MNVLFVTSEFAGLAKAGGLGDVAAGLPAALRGIGIDVRVLMPAYRAALAQLPNVTWIGRLPGRGVLPGCRIGEAKLPNGTILYLVGAPTLYDRDGSPYCTPDGRDWPDNHLRFARLSLAAAEIVRGRGRLGWSPDLLHVHDWPGALAPAYLRWSGVELPSVMTIHNIAHQGNFPASLCDGLGVPERAFHINGVEFNGALSFLKAGVFYADHVTTVSPSYAREIATLAAGCGLHGLIAGRAAQAQVSGIVNGIDESWHPGRDPYLPHHFDAYDLRGKRANADLVRVSLCLRPSDGPLFGIVSRLVHQKGLDIVAAAAHDIVGLGGQIAILGLGDPEIEHMLSKVARQYRDDIGVLVGFNEPMARRIIAGSDFTLMPSRFEPCGLTQMQAQHYGALPIAHATGGLLDTIEDGITGFLFSDLTHDGLVGACMRAFDAFDDAAQLTAMQRAAMARRFGWDEPAAVYAALYARLTNRIVPVGTARPHGMETGRVHPRTWPRPTLEPELETAAA